MTANVVRLGQGTRRLSSWVAGFLEYSEGLQSNEDFRQWTAIAMVAGALERKVWVNSQGSPQYPNLYTFLVGPPGTGKTRPVHEALKVWSKLTGLEADKHHAARVSLTKAALMDQLASSHRVVGDDVFNSLLIPSLELGALIPNYDPDFLNALTYLYDGIRYDEQRRGNKEALVIDKPIVNLIGCTTPSYLLSTMPIGAWDQGFLARVILIYSDHTDYRPLNLLTDSSNLDSQLYDALAHDIQEIGSRVGRMLFTPEAARRLESWVGGDSDPRPERVKTAPDHPRLQHYNTRRPIHILKLCMIAAVDANHTHIEIDDVNTALGWLYKAEARMGGLFVAMASGGDIKVMEECWHFAISIRTRDPSVKSIPQYKIREFLANKVPAFSVQRVVDEMLRCGMLEHTSEAGVPGYLPRASFRMISTT